MFPFLLFCVFFLFVLVEEVSKSSLCSIWIFIGVNDYRLVDSCHNQVYTELGRYWSIGEGLETSFIHRTFNVKMLTSTFRAEDNVYRYLKYYINICESVLLFVWDVFKFWAHLSLCTYYLPPSGQKLARPNVIVIDGTPLFGNHILIWVVKVHCYPWNVY